MARRDGLEKNRDAAFSDSEKASGLDSGAREGRRMPGKVTVEPIKRTDYEQTRRRARRKRVFVDLLVLFLLLALIGGMVAGIWFLIGHYRVQYSTAEVTYTVLFEDVPDALLFDADGDPVIGIGTRLYLHGIANDRDELGEITKTEVVAMDSDEDRSDLLVTVTATATYHRDMGYRVSETRIAVGQELSCRFNRLIRTGTVMNLTLTKEES